MINQITEIFKFSYLSNLLMDFKNSFTDDLRGEGGRCVGGGCIFLRGCKFVGGGISRPFMDGFQKFFHR